MSAFRIFLGLMMVMLCSLAGAVSHPAMAADEGSLDGPMHVFMMPFNNQHFIVESTDGTTYSNFQPGIKVKYNGTVTVLMKKGKIREYYVYMGNCTGDNCVLLSENQLVHQGNGDNDDPKFLQEGFFPSLRSHWIPGFDGSATQNPVAGEVIDKCNLAAQQSGNDSETHQFSHMADMTLGVDTYRGVTDFQQASQGEINDPYDWTQDPPPDPGPEDVDNDFTKHFQVELPIVCAPLDGSPPDVEMLTAGELPDLELIAAELGLAVDGGFPQSSVTYSGSCPMGLTLHAGVATNVQGEVQGYIEHKNVAGVNWTSEEFTLSTEPTEGSLWKKAITDLQQLPFSAPLVPFNPGGGGVVDNQPGGGFQFNPGGGDTGPDPIGAFQAENNTTDGNQHTGYYRFTAYTGKQVLPIGPGGSDVVAYENYKRTGWKKYEITCDPETSSVADTAPDGIQTGTFAEDALLTLIPNNPEDGSACGIWAFGWIKTNTGAVPVTFRLRNQAGDLSGSQTIISQTATLAANFAEYIDLTGSDSGVWVTPSGQWSLPDTSNVGNHVGSNTGSYQIAVSNPNEQDSNVAEYDFECYPPAALLNPDVATNGDLAVPGRTRPFGLLVPAVQAAPDWPVDPEPQGQDEDVVEEYYDEDPPIIIIPAPIPEIEGADPIEPYEPEIAICRNGRIYGNRCICPPGWNRERISRFEYICYRPVQRVICEDGKIRNGKCRCENGWTRKKIGNNAYRCIKQQADIICEGGKVRNGKCRCGDGFKRQKTGNNAFRCVKEQVSIICEGGKVRNGKCRCGDGFKRQKTGNNAYRCVKQEANIICEGGKVRNGKCRCGDGFKRQKTGNNAFRCVKEQVSIICEGGKVRNGKCRCGDGFKRQKTGNNAFRCVKQEANIICEGGKVRNGKCRCGDGFKRQKTGNNAFRCVKQEANIICEGGKVRNGKCRCGDGLKRKKLQKNVFRCVQ